jgi:hypothetical protein
MATLFDAATAVFALIAAGFWFASAKNRVPPLVMYWDRAPDDDPFVKAFNFATRMNRSAALFSGLSALSACVSVIVRASRGA